MFAAVYSDVVASRSGVWVVSIVLSQAGAELSRLSAARTPHPSPPAAARNTSHSAIRLLFIIFYFV